MPFPERDLGLRAEGVRCRLELIEFRPMLQVEQPINLWQVVWAARSL